MKECTKKILCVLAALTVCLITMPFCVSADETLTVNGKEVSKGDIVTYEYYVGGIDDPIAAAGCYIEYDPTFLEYVDDSIGFDVFNNAIYSMNEGVIYYSAVNGVSGYDMKSEKLAVSISFKVLDTAKGSTNITHTFDEFFTIEDFSTDLTADDYEDSDSLKVNGYEGTNTAPYLGTDADEMQDYLTTNSHSIDEILEGNPNSEVNSSESSSKEDSTSENVSSKIESDVSDSSAASKVSSDKDKTSTAADSKDSESKAAVSSSESVGNVSSEKESDTAETEDSAGQSSVAESQNISSSDEASKEKGGNGIVAVIGILFAVVLVGAGFYFFKSKNNN